MSNDVCVAETYYVKVSKFFKDDTLLQDFIAKIAYKIADVKWSDPYAPHLKDTECFYDFIELTDTHRSRRCGSRADGGDYVLLRVRGDEHERVAEISPF